MLAPLCNCKDSSKYIDWAVTAPTEVIYSPATLKTGVSRSIAQQKNKPESIRPVGLVFKLALAAFIREHPLRPQAE
jgi:hypothetical protein